MLFKTPNPVRHQDGLWQNWAGTLRARPQAMPRPFGPEGLREALLTAPGPIRVGGAGHSATPLVPSDGTILSLDEFQGIDVVDDRRVWVRGGTRLKALNSALWGLGLSLPNLPDIDAPSIAGATATASHGTGATLPCLSAQIEGIQMMTAAGDLREADAQTAPDLLKAAQVSLGALGVITALKLRVRPRLMLHRRSWVETLDETLEKATARWARHRNYEFSYLPFSGLTFNISHMETTAEETPHMPHDDDTSVMQLRRVTQLLSRWTGARRAVLQRMMRMVIADDCVGPAQSLLVSVRKVPVLEMEYHLPQDGALGVLRALLTEIERRHRDVYFPIDVRITAPDDAFLSPFEGGARVSLAFQSFYRDDAKWLYDTVEPHLRAAGGRPHWGKLHSLKAADLEPLYPGFGRFAALRQEMDPKGRFLTPALRDWLVP